MTLQAHILEDLVAHGYEEPSFFTIIKAYFTHPSIRVLSNYRIGLRFDDNNTFFRFVKRLLWGNSAFHTGCHISPKSMIEPGVIFPHASGIVIGNGAYVKSGTKVFQHVTLAVENDEEDTAPTISENVTIYAGAVVIGDITVGEGAIIGANAVVKQDVPSDMMAVGIPAQIKPQSNSMREESSSASDRAPSDAQSA